MSDFKILDTWYEKKLEEILKDFFQFLRFSSISSDKKYEKDICSCANWLSDYLQERGWASTLLQTHTFPVVYAEKLCEQKDVPTLLIYGHYDVQPVDPLEEWESFPFEPTIRDNQVYARGAVDDKGQVFYTIAALQAIWEIEKSFPFNIKLCIEGEEEANSSGLLQLIEKEKNRLKADYLLVPDVHIPDINTPALTMGVRGMIPLSVEFIASNSDLHSGDHGGIAYNPLRACVEVLAKLWDENNRVTVAGFYDDVLELTDEQKKAFALDFDQEKYSKTFGIKAFSNEKGYSILESNWIRPTLEINGIGGGYFGEGVKTVIPKKVIAKLSCRLVPNQDPKKVGQAVARFLKKHVKEGIEIKVDIGQGGLALRAKSDSVLVQAVAQAYSDVFKKDCQKILSGGSIPVIAKIAKELQCDVVFMGMGLNDDNLHAPNEHFGLDRFKKGFLTIARSIQILGDLVRIDT